MQAIKNEAMLTTERETLRRAKRDLQEYERNMDEELPKMQNMRDFQREARDEIEGLTGRIRSEIPRSPEEEEAVDRKIRKL